MASRTTPQNTIIKGIVLLAVLVVLMFFMHKLPILTQYTNTLFNEESVVVGGEEQMVTDSLRESHYKDITGFWVRNTPTADDRIEILENGILWRYTKRTEPFPYGMSDEIVRVGTSYLLPNKVRADSSVVSNLRIIREAWLTPDTCYGNTFYDIIAQTRYSNDTLYFDDAAYVRYQGKMSEFFPKGILALVDDLNLPSCNSEDVFLNWLRTGIAASFNEREIPLEMLATEQFQLLRDYYIPACLAQASQVLVEGKQYDLDMTVYIDTLGKVEVLDFKSRDIPSKSTIAVLVREVQKWRFPTDGEVADTIEFHGKFTQL